MNFHVEYEPLVEGSLVKAAQIPWDSELYGIPFYELDCNQSDQQGITSVVPTWLKHLTRPAFVFTRIDGKYLEKISTLASMGFYTAETTLDLFLTLSNLKLIVPRIPANLILRTAQVEDIEHIVQLAHAAFWADRFHLDPALNQETSNLRYARWVRRGYEEGDPLLVCANPTSGEIIGFYLLRETAPGIINLNLAAVAPKYQRSGLGVVMYQLTLQECIQRGYTVANTTVSVNNLDVVNLFMRLGFSIRTAVMTLHLPLS